MEEFCLLLRLLLGWFLKRRHMSADELLLMLLNYYSICIYFCTADFIVYVKLLFSDLGVQGQITTRVALQGGALTQHTRHFVANRHLFCAGCAE